MKGFISILLFISLLWYLCFSMIKDSFLVFELKNSDIAFYLLIQLILFPFSYQFKVVLKQNNIIK